MPLLLFICRLRFLFFSFYLDFSPFCRIFPILLFCIFSSCFFILYFPHLVHFSPISPFLPISFFLSIILRFIEFSAFSLCSILHWRFLQFGYLGLYFRLFSLIYQVSVVILASFLDFGCFFCIVGTFLSNFSISSPLLLFGFSFRPNIFSLLSLSFSFHWSIVLCFCLFVSIFLFLPTFVYFYLFRLSGLIKLTKRIN